MNEVPIEEAFRIKPVDADVVATIAVTDGPRPVSRRAFVLGAMGTGLAYALTRFANGNEPATRPAAAGWMDQRYKIGVCDWMLLKRQKLGAFKWASQCGIDGVEVDMGGLGTNPDLKNELRKPDVLQSFLDTSKSSGVGICSLALSAFYGQSIGDHPKGDDFLHEMIELGGKMGTRVGFLPMGVKVNLRDDAEQRRKVVERLKRVGPAAEKEGFVIGIESNLNAEEHLRFLDEVGSAGVGIYYNFGTAMDSGWDLTSELKTLGHRVCQIHCTDRDGKWLQDGRIDMPKVKATLDEIGWRGWLVLERSRMEGKKVEENFAANAKYMKSVFQA